MRSLSLNTVRSRAAALMLAVGAFAPGCECTDPAPAKRPHEVGSFAVELTSIKQPNGQALSSGDGLSLQTEYPFPFGEVVFHVRATALDENGQPFPDYNRPAAVRITPGDLNVSTRWLPNTGNGVVEGDVRVSHVFGKTNLWVMDRAPLPVYGDAGPIDPGAPGVPLNDDGSSPYTFAEGTSPTRYFRKPTLVDVQRVPGCDPNQSFSAPAVTCAGVGAVPACVDTAHGNTQYQCYQGQCMGTCDNRISPLTGDFVALETEYYEDGGANQDMIVTAITQDGFYVYDRLAQKLNDPANPVSGAYQALPGYFNSLFVYTYSAPTNLYVGDHLINLAGSVQEFSGDTQLDFPSWLKVDAQPTLNQVPQPTLIGLHECGVDPAKPATVDPLCGYYNSNMLLESLESAPVYVANVKPTNHFQNCDTNGNSTLPLFVNSKTTFDRAPGNWGCFNDDPTDFSECECEISCITGLAEPTADYSATVCSELSTFNTYGQWEVVLPGPVAPDGGIYNIGTRINVTTRDALSSFNPLDLEKPEFANITFDVAGMLNQVQASRPRWLIYARDGNDICCHKNGAAACPNGIRDCDPIGGQ